MISLNLVSITLYPLNHIYMYLIHILRVFFGKYIVSISLHMDVPHGFDVFVAIISMVCYSVTTSVVFTTGLFCTKPNSGITISGIIFVVTEKSNPCVARLSRRTLCIETFLVIIQL